MFDARGADRFRQAGSPHIVCQQRHAPITGARQKMSVAFDVVFLIALAETLVCHAADVNAEPGWHASAPSLICFAAQWHPRKGPKRSDGSQRCTTAIKEIFFK